MPVMNVGDRGARHERHVLLDGLRGVAAVVVTIYHMKEWLPPGMLANAYLAVDFFFMLSGFVIGEAYGDRLRTGEMTFTAFARRRALRLLPMIFVGAVIGETVALLFIHMDFSERTPLEMLAAFPLAALALPAPWLEQPFLINLPTWSLFYEFIASFVFAAFVVRLGDRALRWGIAVLALILVAIVVTRGGLDVGETLAGIPAALVRVAVSFGIGLWLQRLVASGVLRMPAVPGWVPALALLALLCVPQIDGPLQPLVICLVVLAGFPAIVLSGRFARCTGWGARLAVFVGALSYPLYIVHFPMKLLQSWERLGAIHPVPLRIAIGLVIFSAAALIAARYAEPPLRALLARIWRG